MRHAASRKLHAYWDALRGTRLAPGRDEVDPAAIRDVLASVFVIVVAPRPLPRPADATFRLSGTRLDALFGRVLRGSAFDRIWADDSAALAAAALDAVLDGRRPVAAMARGGPPDAEAIDLELLLLPLETRTGLGTPILGSLAAAGTPSWLGLSAAAPLALRALGPPRSDERTPGFGRRGPWHLSVQAGGGGGAIPTDARP